MKTEFLFSSGQQLAWAFIAIELLAYRWWPTTQLRHKMLETVLFLRFDRFSFVNVN
jgi:hypothetical protein